MDKENYTGDENAFNEALYNKVLAVAPKTLTMSIHIMVLETLGFSELDLPILANPAAVSRLP